MALFDGTPIMEVVSLENGQYGVRATGGNILSGIIAEFATQAEAEEWMMNRTGFADSGSGILKPGGGENVS